MSSPEGEVKRSSCAVSNSGSKTTIAPTTITASWRAMSAKAMTSSRACRVPPVTPSMFSRAASTTTAPAMTSSCHPLANSPHAGVR
jgi:hypothetical protein